MLVDINNGLCSSSSGFRRQGLEEVEFDDDKTYDVPTTSVTLVSGIPASNLRGQFCRK